MESIVNNDHLTRLETWKSIEHFIPLLFKESNPAPIKYYLSKKGLIKSAELRLPLTEISENLKLELNKLL
jgi:4-hydroxy-tetrahydrodipicolinate synthase